MTSLEQMVVNMIEHMKSLRIELDDEVAAKLESVAPGRSRLRSEFIRNAIRSALWELEERATRDAYHRQPDSAADAYLDPALGNRARPAGGRLGEAIRNSLEGPPIAGTSR